MIQLSELTKSFGDRVLLDHVTWQITDRERVGLCGPNGAGKTTLLRMMADLEEPDSGAVLKPAALTVGYLPQDGLTHSGRSVFEEAAGAFGELVAIKAEMHALEDRLGDPAIPEAEHDAMLHRYSDLQDRFRLRDGYSIELKTATVLQGLGFKTSDFDRPTETFSGGWQMRIALAKLLLGQPNLLLLDEPTNHLDLEARNWLEEYLNAYPHAVILVSHDRFFLDAVVTRIADLTLRTLTDYHTNYSGYLAEHHERIEAMRKAKREQDEEVARVKMFIDRFRYKATKASQVQSRIKMLEKVVPIEVPPERKKIHFDFPSCAKSGRMVLELKHARKAYGDLVVFGGLTLHIERGDRIALVGPNGVGKSTLMRMLSGGERTRLAVARMLLRPSNTLLLDEPTNHLDLDSKEVLLDALVDYGGTLIFVSHDRYFVERLATKIIEVGNGTAVPFPGTYKEFLWHKEHGGEVPSGQQGAKAAGATANGERPFQGRQKDPDTKGKDGDPRRVGAQQKPKQSHEEKKRVDAEARKKSRELQARQQRIDSLESRIAETEAAIRELEQQMSAPGFYEDRAAAQPLIDRHQALMWQVGDLMHQWETLQALADEPTQA